MITYDTGTKLCTGALSGYSRRYRLTAYQERIASHIYNKA